LVGATRFDLDNLAVLLRRCGAGPVVCGDWMQFQARLDGGATQKAVFVEIALATRDLAERVSEAIGAIPLFGFARGEPAVDAHWLVDLGLRELLRLPGDEAALREMLAGLEGPEPELIVRAPEMQRVVAVVDRVAQSDAPVLIIGETGTGKEVIARRVHRSSRRADGPFVSINCAAIPEQLLESELFGHEKGAFTGALTRRVGKFEEAAGGTLLLDEIGEMDLRLQAKLLRAIQERQIDRVGGRGPVSVDLRIVATTNRDLMAEVDARRFREDLYYRLNVINIELPALRERPADIRPLVEHFVQKYCDKNGIAPKTVDAEAMARLETFAWPGNVRELENTVYRAVLISNARTIVADDIIFTRHQGAALANRNYAERVVMAHAPVAPAAPPPLPPAPPPPREDGPVVAPPSSSAAPPAAAAPPPSAPAPGAPIDAMSDPGGATAINAFVGKSIAEIEEELIKATLEHCYGNRTRAATILGISIQTLRNKLERYNA
jgi:DNA-binding NtrC family response regulator